MHLAWKSTLYVTNFPESADDKSIRELFGKVRPLNRLSVPGMTQFLAVWGALRRQVAEQEVQKHPEVLLRTICVSRE